MGIVLRCSACLAYAAALLAQQGTTVENSPFQTVPPAPVVSDSLTFSTIVPIFEATDLNGKVWRSSDFRDKVTLVSIWGVYCLPCRAEQPALQDFFNTIHSTNKVQVITFCLDTQPNRVLSYMRKQGYTFPVIVSNDVETKLFPIAGGIPKTFVIGPNGRRTEPFKSWTFGRILLEVDKIAKTI